VTDDRPPIVTYHAYPPIPTRRFDWCAFRDGQEELGNYGWGPTEEAAIQDLHEREAEEYTDTRQGPHPDLTAPGGAS